MLLVFKGLCLIFLSANVYFRNGQAWVFIGHEFDECQNSIYKQSFFITKADGKAAI